MTSILKFCYNRVQWCTLTMHISTGRRKLFFIRCQWVDDVICNLLLQIRPHIKWNQWRVWVRAWYNVFSSLLRVVRLWVMNGTGELCQVIDWLFTGQFKRSFCKKQYDDMIHILTACLLAKPLTQVITLYVLKSCRQFQFEEVLQYLFSELTLLSKLPVTYWARLRVVFSESSNIFKPRSC